MIDNDSKQKSGFEDDDDTWDKRKFCNAPGHNPPGYIVIPPGKRYRHVCPTCGKVSIVHNRRITL